MVADVSSFDRPPKVESASWAAKFFVASEDATIW